MNSLDREASGFSGRLWHEIDQTVNGVRMSNGTARRILPVDGPYGLGLSSVAGDDAWLNPGALGANINQWDVTRPATPPPGGPPLVAGRGTYLVQSPSRPVPLIASEFYLGMRAIEAYEAGCQPLDLCAATAAARDVALEEERLLYYGTGPADDALLRVYGPNTTLFHPGARLHGLHRAIEALAQRGFAGPFALTVEPPLYTALYRPVVWAVGGAPATAVLLVDILRNMFRGGVYMAPVIDPQLDGILCRVGAIVTVGRAYSRLVVGQDWVTAYRGRTGVLHRFLIQNSLQLRICQPRSIQVLRIDPTFVGNPNRYWL